MTPARKRRLGVVLLVVFGVGLAAALALRAFEDNLLFFYSPTQVLDGDAPADKRFRVGGLVEEGSVQRAPGSLALTFTLTDYNARVTVAYEGLLPNLFREGQGVIAHGTLRADGVFAADEILARHDENYTAPAVQEALETGRRTQP